MAIYFQEEPSFKIKKAVIETAISQPVFAEITFFSPKDPTNWLQKSITLYCSTDSHSESYQLWVYKIIASENGGEVHYIFSCYHDLFKLQLANNYRTFSNQSFKDIVLSLLDGISYEDQVMDAASSQEIVIQYGETNWEFLQKLMKEGGFFFIIKNNKIIFSSSTAIYKVVNTPTTFFGTWSFFSSVRSITAKNINTFYNPTTLQQETMVGNHGNYFYLTGSNNSVDQLDNYCSIKKDQQATGEISLFSQEFSMDCGCVITAENKKLLIVKIKHIFEAHKQNYIYKNHMSLVEYRRYLPNNSWNWPLPLLSAQVVEQFSTDDFLRIPVKFLWDSNNNVHMIRVLAGMAGKGFGLQFIPQPSQEVIVQFLNNSFCSPVIIGSGYNAQSKAPYGGQNNTSCIKTLSSDSNKYNEFFISATEDKEEVRLRAQKDFNITVATGNYNIDIQKESLIINIKKDLNLTIGGDANITVNGNVTLKANNCTMEANGDLVLKSSSKIEFNAPQLNIEGSNLSIKTTTFSTTSTNYAVNSNSFKIISALAEIESSLISLQGSNAKIEASIIDLIAANCSVKAMLGVMGVITQNGQPVMVL